MVQHAIGGETVTTTVEGRERYPVSVRLMADFRSDLEALGRLPVAAADGRQQIPLEQLATIDNVAGPSMIRNEDGLLTGYVYVDLADRDPGTYVAEARRAGHSSPPGTLRGAQHEGARPRWHFCRSRFSSVMQTQS